MKESFENFSGQDYIQGACLTLENAKKHISASELLLINNNIGIAISHLILGAEEYIKSFILLCLNGDKDFINNNDKIELFKNHKFKHKHISLFIKSVSNSQAIRFENDSFNRFVNNIPNSSIYSLDGYYINKVFNLVKLDDNQLLELETWLLSANDLKNNGFYLGLKEYWTSPENFQKKDYEIAFKCVKILKDSIEPLFSMPLTDDDFIDYLNRESDF